MATKPDISKRAFWDVDFEQLDYEANAQAVILRVLERGNYDDMIAVMKYHGSERLIAEITSAPHVPLQIINFISTVFGVEPERFRCNL